MMTEEEFRKHPKLKELPVNIKEGKVLYNAPNVAALLLWERLRLTRDFRDRIVADYELTGKKIGSFKADHQSKQKILDFLDWCNYHQVKPINKCSYEALRLLAYEYYGNRATALRVAKFVWLVYMKGRE